MEKRIEETATTYELPLDDAAVLLRHLKWDESKLYECENLEDLQKKAGIIPTLIDEADTGVMAGKFVCSICDEEEMAISDSFKLKCGHRFCLGCWRNYLQIKSQEMKYLDIECPSHKCHVIVPKSAFSSLTGGIKIKGEESADKAGKSGSDGMRMISMYVATQPDSNYTLDYMYRQQALAHFVQFDPHLVWCTFPNCGSIIHCTDIDATLGAVELICDCGRSLCFPCTKNRYTNSGEFHYPAQCAQATKWEQRTSEELKFFSLRRKPCPSKKCKTPIIKCGCGTKVICNELDYCPKQACNHMCCPVCSYHFCWICGREWEGHNDYYNCNKEVSEDLSDHQRFKLCFERYANHNGGQKAAKMKRDREAKTYFHQLIKDGKTGRNVNFMEEACDELMRCYGTLKNTYIFVYYAHFETPALKQLFEYNQGQLEKMTDQLQEKIEKETKPTKQTHLFTTAQMENVLKGVEAGEAKLKHAETVDKSAPVIESDVKIGTNNHGALLGEVTKGAELKHVETVDKSAPVIENDVKIGTNNHAALLSEIKKE
eukprot:TRINITY_DN93_c0_g1_i8.p1 TRINITY_DN93_c0_g1~~TRINITY_DN93_c0_g1_i8.p1  ORF type:complete len:634 (-),score=264.72 TRINITY_DN93_c0_g1_i8:384-2012(-)